MVRPSVMARTLASWPSRRSSMRICLPAPPKPLPEARRFTGVQGFGAAVANEDAFAGSESVGLDDAGDIFPIAEVSHGRGEFAEDLILGRGDVGLAEEVFAEDFAAFQFGGGFRWAEDAEFFCLEGVDNAGDERRFGTDDGEVDFVFLGEADEACEVGRGEIDIFSVDGGSGVAWRDEDALHTGALFDFPSQSVFAAAVANNQDVHC